MKKYIEGTADRIIKFMGGLNSTLEGYRVSRLEHSLQTATRAFHDQASEEMIVASLLHDIGDELAPLNHAEYAASVLKPYVSEKFTGSLNNMEFFKHTTMLIILEEIRIKETSLRGTNIILMR